MNLKKVVQYVYQPRQVAEMWDTWLYYHKDKHYLFYLHKSEQESGAWDGMSIAVSEDGVHYQEVGPIIHKREDAVWLGTGSTWKTEQGFVLNFSESRNDVQNIFFAQSNDLLHWQILGDEFRSAPDARWYDDTPKGRWDCIWTIARPGGGFYGYLTARPWNKIRGMNYESIGMLESNDGLHWSHRGICHTISNRRSLGWTGYLFGTGRKTGYRVWRHDVNFRHHGTYAFQEHAI
jgi:hypothetical protein